MRWAGLFLCLLVLPLAFAVESFTLVIDGDSVKYVPSSDHSFSSVRVYFLPESDDSVGVKAGAVDTRSDTVGVTRQISVLSCKNAPDGCFVTLNNVPVIDGVVTIEFSETFRPSTGLEPIVSRLESEPFVVDDQGPSFDRISLTHCNECFVLSSGASDISFFLHDDAGINTESLQIYVSGSRVPLVFEEVCIETRPAQEATDEQPAIEGSGEYDCIVTLPTNLFISGSSSEVVLQAEDKTGARSRFPMIFRYDSTPPRVIESVRVDPDPNNIGAGSAAVLSVLVEDPEGAFIRVSGDLLESHEQIQTVGFFEQSCSRDAEHDGLFACSIEVPIPSAQELGSLPTTDQLIVSIRDLAGNTIPDIPTTITVKAADVSTEPDFWLVTAETSRPIDATTWLVHEKFLPVKLTLDRKFGAGGAIPIAIDVVRCVHPGLPGAGGSNVRSDPIIPDTVTQLDLTLPPTGPPGADPTSAAYTEPLRCTLEITSRSGDIIFANPETDEVEIPLRFNQLDNPLSQFQHAKDRVEKRIDRQSADLDRWVKITSSIRQLCGPIPQTILGASSVMNGAAAGTVGVPFLTPVARGLDIGSQALQGTAGSILGQFGFVCDAIACQEGKNFYNKMLSNVPGGSMFQPGSKVGAVVGAVGGVDNAGQLIDPYKSEYLAYATFCLPAVVYHKQVRLNVACEYQSCLDQAAATGITVQECKNARDYQECRHTASNIIFALPWTNAYQVLVDRLRAIAQNPIGAIFGGVSTFLCGGNDLANSIGLWDLSIALPLPARIGCNVLRIGNKIDLMISFGEKVRQTADDFRNIFGSQSDYCAAVQNIPPPTSERPFDRTECSISGYCTFDAGGKGYVVLNNRIYYIDDQQQFHFNPDYHDPNTPAPTNAKIGSDAMQAFADEHFRGGMLKGPLDSCDSVRGDSGQCEEALNQYQDYYDGVWQDVRAYTEYDDGDPSTASFTELLRERDGDPNDPNNPGLNQRLKDLQTARSQPLPNFPYQSDEFQVRGKVSRDLRNLMKHQCGAGSESCTKDANGHVDASAHIRHLLQNPSEIDADEYPDLSAYAQYVNSGEFQFDILQEVGGGEFFNMRPEDQQQVVDGAREEIFGWIEEAHGERRDIELEQKRVRDAIDENKRQWQKLADRVEIYMLNQQLQTGTGKLRHTVNAALTYGRVGRVLFSAVGLGNGNGDVWGLGNFADGIVNYIDLERQVIDNYCKNRFEEEDVVLASNVALGQPLVRLSADAASIAPLGFQYVINLYANFPEISDVDAARTKLVFISNTGSEIEVTPDIPLNFFGTEARVGTNAISITENHNIPYEHVCVILAEGRELGEYFQHLAGASSRANRLCADIEVRE